jgi:hypothetical protein
MSGLTAFRPGSDLESPTVLLQAVAKTVLLAREAGLEIDDLLELLGAGLTPADVLEIIMMRLTTSADSPGVLGGGARSRPMIC